MTKKDILKEEANVLEKEALDAAKEGSSLSDEENHARDVLETSNASEDEPEKKSEKKSPLHLVRLIQQRMGPGFVHNEEALAFGERAEVNAEVLLDVLRFLKRDPDADLEILVDLSCVDHLQNAPKGRFEIFYVLRSVRLPYQLSLHLFVDEESPEVPSISSLYSAADWLERELWDLFGIYADGHPHLRRILLYPGFTSHPMLQDYPSTKSQPLVPLRSPLRPVVVVSAEGILQQAALKEGNA